MKPAQVRKGQIWRGRPGGPEYTVTHVTTYNNAVLTCFNEDEDEVMLPSYVLLSTRNGWSHIGGTDTP